jgi:hypothetical protein
VQPGASPPQVHVPKEGVSIAFAPSGIKTPARAQAASHGRPAVTGEPFADEAFAFTRDNFMQREVRGWHTERAAERAEAGSRRRLRAPPAPYASGGGKQLPQR